jgi:hypothetical protein
MDARTLRRVDTAAFSIYQAYTSMYRSFINFPGSRKRDDEVSPPHDEDSFICCHNHWSIYLGHYGNLIEILYRTSPNRLIYDREFKSLQQRAAAVLFMASLPCACAIQCRSSRVQSADDIGKKAKCMMGISSFAFQLSEALFRFATLNSKKRRMHRSRSTSTKLGRRPTERTTL